jgi:hypothetical protein
MFEGFTVSEIEYRYEKRSGAPNAHSTAHSATTPPPVSTTHLGEAPIRHEPIWWAENSGMSNIFTPSL